MYRCNALFQIIIVYNNKDHFNSMVGGFLSDAKNMKTLEKPQGHIQRQVTEATCTMNVAHNVKATGE